MTSLTNVSNNFCDWRAHIQKDDSLQAWDGKAWRMATVYGLNYSHDGVDEVDVYFNKAPSKQGVRYNRDSNCIRPTIGFLRRKIMVPQAQQITLLKHDVDNLRNDAVDDHKEINRLNRENKFLKQQLAEMSANQHALQQQVHRLQDELDRHRIHEQTANEHSKASPVASPITSPKAEPAVSPKASMQSPTQSASPTDEETSSKVLKPPITSYDRIRKKYGNKGQLDEIDESRELKQDQERRGKDESVVKQTYGAFKLKIKKESQQGSNHAFEPEDDDDMKLEELQTTPGNQDASSSASQKRGKGGDGKVENEDDDDIGDDDDSGMIDID